jgi:hypothetical protein
MKRLIILLVLLFVVYLIWSRNFYNRLVDLRITSRDKSKPFARDGDRQISPKPEPSTTEQLRSLIESDNALIKFYGLVMDEKGSPLSDVEVSWDVLKSGSFAPSLLLPTKWGPCSQINKMLVCFEMIDHFYAWHDNLDLNTRTLITM